VWIVPTAQMKLDLPMPRCPSHPQSTPMPAHLCTTPTLL
jgi:hypothetical protein